MVRTASRPSGPANSAVCGSHSRTASSSSAVSSATYGGLATDEVEHHPGGQRVEPVARGDADAGAAPTEPGEVGPGDVEGVRRCIGQPDHRAEWELVGDRQADGARARPEVGDRDGAGQRPGQVDRDAGDDLGLGPRDQHAAVDGEVEVPEAPAPEHVGERLAGPVPGDHRVEVGDHPLGRRLVEDVLDAVGPARHLAQPAGRRPLARPRPRSSRATPASARRHSRRSSGTDGAAPAAHGNVSSASWRARSSAARAATTSSRSPARTSASR